MSEEYINSLYELKNIKKKDIFVFLLIFLFVIFFDNLLIAHKFEFVSILVVISIPFMWNTYSKINKYKEKQHDSDIKNILDEEFYEKAIENFKYNIQLPFIFSIFLVIFYFSFIGNKLYVNILSYSFITAYIWFIIYIPQIYELFVEKKSRKNLKEFLQKKNMKYDKFEKIYKELFNNNYSFNREEFGINDEFLFKAFINQIKKYLQKKENIDAYRLFNLIDFEKRNQNFINTTTKESLELYKYIEEEKESLRNYQFIQSEIKDYLYNLIIYSIEENPRMFYYISKNFKEFISNNFDPNKYEQYKNNNTYQIRLLDFFLNNIFKIYLNNKVKTESKIKFKKNISKFWKIDIDEINKNKKISDHIVEKYLNFIITYINNGKETKSYIIDDFTKIFFPKVKKQVFLTILLFNKLIKFNNSNIKDLLKEKWIFLHGEYFTTGTEEETYEIIRLLSNFEFFKKDYINKKINALNPIANNLTEKEKEEELTAEERLQKDNCELILEYYKKYLNYLEKNKDK